MYSHDDPETESAPAQMTFDDTMDLYHQRQLVPMDSISPGMYPRVMDVDNKG